MRRYNPKEIEPKWQAKWEESGIYNVDFNSKKPKYVGFGMFNYPSGAGIHVGHVRNFTIPDVITRTKRQQGFESYQPVGWDSFGMPAENYAIKTGVAPQVSIKQAIEKYHTQYRAMGWAMDWSKEIDTIEPEYYKWTQWCFAKLFENGLAYQKESPQWWCDQCKTVLADEQVIAGQCWRHDNPDDPFVTKRSLRQWFFKITDYADELLEATDDLNWTQSVKSSQKSWIGKSKGAEIDFRVCHPELGSGSDKNKAEDSNKSDEILKQVQDDKTNKTIKVFTTRPDTLFGATFLVLAPEHPLVSQITTEEYKKEVEKYTEAVLVKSEVQRQQDADKEKTGIFTGAYAINPINNKKIPIWIADYVLMGYGTGAIMAVPAHDERDNQFAKKFDLSVTSVIEPVTNVPKDSVEITDRGEAVIAVVINPKNKKFLTVNWIKNKQDPTGQWAGNLFIGGGVEEGEDYIETARREIQEETGYKNVKFVSGTETSIHHHYYSVPRESWRKAKIKGLLFELIDEERVEQKLEEYEKDQFVVEWVPVDQIETKLKHDDAHEFVYKLLVKAECYHGEGVMVNSGLYDGMISSAAREKILEDLKKQGQATEKVQYKMRDWLISRQRYWGAPIPIIHCETDGPVLVPEADLPVVLPVIEDYRPTGGEASVLAGVEEWVNTTCPKCGGPGKRETDTMDGYVCSSWYFLRYMDPSNNKQAWDPKIAGKWMPIDCYNGGDHATAHLLYARFFNRFFHKLGLVESQEPFKKMIFNGKIKAGDGTAFSKSKGNGIDPLEVIEQGYGADAIRLYEMFAAPIELDVLWDIQGIPGAYRFLSRVWNITQEYIGSSSGESKADNEDILKITHKMIKKVTEDIEEDRFNTAIASLMELTNYLYKAKESTGIFQSGNWRFAIESLLMLVAPFAPHIAEELWSELGNKDTIHVDHWPMWEDKYLQFDTMKIVVQVNGKVRSTVEVDSDATKEQVIEITMKDKKVAEYLNGNSVKKTIYVPSRLVNFVI